MPLKPEAKQSFLKQLTEHQEDLTSLGIDIHTLEDKQLKQLYLLSQKVRQRGCLYAIGKNANFEEVMAQGRLQFVSFSDTYHPRYGLRPLTLKELIRLMKFVELNPGVYHGNLFRF
jgi:hypothetical protein